MSGTNRQKENATYSRIHDPKLVWYACYGSNLKRERFLSYIKGGRPPGSTKCQPGCSDHSLPREEKTLELPRRLYFSGYSRSWGGGVAFIEGQERQGERTLARMYLITRTQFREVFAQENSMEPPGHPIHIDQLLEEGEQVVGGGWYSRVLFLGVDRESGYPILSFTSPVEEETNFTKPTPAYLKTILDGLLESFPGMERREALDYLRTTIHRSRS